MRLCASRIAATPRARFCGAEVSDLEQAGFLGFLDAFSQFESNRARLWTYAQPRVLGAMLDLLRNYDELPRALRHEVTSAQANQRGETRKTYSHTVENLARGQRSLGGAPDQGGIEPVSRQRMALDTIEISDSLLERLRRKPGQSAVVMVLHHGYGISKRVIAASLALPLIQIENLLDESSRTITRHRMKMSERSRSSNPRRKRP